MSKKNADSGRFPLVLPASIEREILKLSRYNATPGDGHGITRLVFSKEDLAARDYLKEKMTGYGLQVHQDLAGNIFGKLEGSKPELPPVWTGSHIDTVLNAGMFDGVIGVIGAIEALRMIKQSGLPFERSLCAAIFTSEEQTRFSHSCRQPDSVGKDDS